MCGPSCVLQAAQELNSLLRHTMLQRMVGLDHLMLPKHQGACFVPQATQACCALPIAVFMHARIS